MKSNAIQIPAESTVFVQAILGGWLADSEVSGLYTAVLTSFNMTFTEWVEKSSIGPMPLLTKETADKAKAYHEYCLYLEAEVVSLFNGGFNLSEGAIFVAKNVAFRLASINTIFITQYRRAVVQIQFEPTTIGINPFQ